LILQRLPQLHKGLGQIPRLRQLPKHLIRPPSLQREIRLGRRPIEDYVKTLAARVNLPAAVVKAAVGLLERNRRLLFGKNPWVSAAAMWLASLKKLGLLKALAEAAGTTPTSIRNAANRLRV
jgi:transcription initiation factor TFIIIB Brf1 subunit/transcription initiation factor TFIIB